MRCLKIFLRKGSFIKGRLFSLYAGLAQLVRAHGLHPWGQRFESVIPHHKTYTANIDKIYVLLVQVQLSRLLGYRTIGSSIDLCVLYILGIGVTATQRPLTPLLEVRVFYPQPTEKGFPVGQRTNH